MAFLSRQLSLTAALIVLLILVLSTGLLLSEPEHTDSNITLLFDPEEKLDIGDVSSEHFQFRFEPWRRHSFDIRQQEGNVWLRVPLSPSQPQPEDLDLLSIQAFSTVNLKVYKAYDEQIEPVTIHYNSHLNNYLFNLSGSADSGYLFINTNAYNVRTLYLSTGPASDLLKRLESLNFHSGSFFAFFSIITLLNFMIWLKDRERKAGIMATISTVIISMMLLWHGYVQWPFGTDNNVPRTPLFILLILGSLLLLSGIHTACQSKSRWLNTVFISMASLLVLAGITMLLGVALSSEILLTLVLSVGITCCLITLISGNRHSIDINTVVAALMILAQMIVLLSIAGVINLNFTESMLVLTHCLALAMTALTISNLLSNRTSGQSMAHDMVGQPPSTKANEVASNRDSSVFDAMGHELRTPMNGILGLAELLQTTHLSKKQGEYLKTLQNSGNDLNNLINLLANAWKGYASTEMTLYNPQELVSDSLSKFASLAEQNQVEIISSIDAGVPHYTEGNPAIVALLLESLLTHAFQHVVQNDIVLKVTTISRHEQQIAYELHFDHPQELLYSFNQKKSYKDYKNTTGMSLSLFLALQQTSHASSRPPQFSNNLKHFRFTTDHFAQYLLNSEPLNTPVFLAFQSLKVMIVDDNPTCRRVLAEQCSLLGLNCLEAESGHEALAMVRNEYHLKRQLDCIILDQNMPGMKGIQLLERLDEELSDREMPPVIMLSGTSNPPDQEQARRLGIRSILTKPVTRFTLQKALLQSIGTGTEPDTPKPKTAEPA